MAESLVGKLKPQWTFSGKKDAPHIMEFLYGANVNPSPLQKSENYYFLRKFSNFLRKFENISKFSWNKIERMEMRKLSENKEITKITKFLFSFESHIFQAFFVFKMCKRKRENTPKRRKKSLIGKVEKILLPYVKKNRGTPISFAIAMSSALGVPVEPKLVWKILSQNNLSLKKASFIPGFSIPKERSGYLQDLKQLWTQVNQAVFLDKKKFKLNEIVSQSCSRGYAPIGTQLQPHMQCTTHLQSSLP